MLAFILEQSLFVEYVFVSMTLELGRDRRNLSGTSIAGNTDLRFWEPRFF